MDLSSPIGAVIPGVRGVVLEILARTSRPLTGNQIAGLCGERASQSGVSIALGRLVSGGVVQCERAGRANLYSLNTDHVAAEAVVQLAQLRRRLLDRITTQLATWEVEPVAAWLFGSAARGDGDEHSDIDVLVVRDDAISADDPTWVRSTMDLAEAVQRWSGNGCEVLEYDRAELLALAQRSDPLVASLRADAMPLWADEPHQLLRSVSR